MGKFFKALYTQEAETELKQLDKQNIKRVLRTVALFEILGQDGVNSKPLGDNLFELKCDKIRIYFIYQENKVIIIGLIALKKTQKAPKQYKQTAISRINKYIKEHIYEQHKNE